MKKLRETRSLARDHAAGKWLGQHSNLGLTGARALPFHWEDRNGQHRGEVEAAQGAMKPLPETDIRLGAYPGHHARARTDQPCSHWGLSHQLPRDSPWAANPPPHCVEAPLWGALASLGSGPQARRRSVLPKVTVAHGYSCENAATPRLLREGGASGVGGVGASQQLPSPGV